MPDLTQLLGPQWGVDTLFRWIITTLALLMALYLSWRNSTEKAHDKVITVQKEQLQILDQNNKTLKEENQHCKDQIAELKKDLEVIKVKTDLSQVIDLLKNFQLMEAERHAEKLKTLGNMMEELHHLTRKTAKKVDQLAHSSDKEDGHLSD